MNKADPEENDMLSLATVRKKVRIMFGWGANEKHPTVRSAVRQLEGAIFEPTPRYEVVAGLEKLRSAFHRSRLEPSIAEEHPEMLPLILRVQRERNRIEELLDEVFETIKKGAELPYQTLNFLLRAAEAVESAENEILQNSMLVDLGGSG